MMDDYYLDFLSLAVAAVSGGALMSIVGAWKSYFQTKSKTTINEFQATTEILLGSIRDMQTSFDPVLRSYQITNDNINKNLQIATDESREARELLQRERREHWEEMRILRNEHKDEIIELQLGYRKQRRLQDEETNKVEKELATAHDEIILHENEYTSLEGQFQKLMLQCTSNEKLAEEKVRRLEEINTLLRKEQT